MTTVTDRLNGISTSVAVKPPCKAVAVANITLSGEQTVNGVAVVEGDRVLVTAQTSSVNNGIYVASTSSWARAADFDGNRDVRQGTLVVVNRASGQDYFYQVDTADPIVIGTSALTFTLTSDPNVIYDITDSEIAADIDPPNKSYVPGHVKRYGSTLNAATIQSALDANAGKHILLSKDETHTLTGATAIDIPQNTHIYVDGGGRAVIDASAATLIGSGLFSSLGTLGSSLGGGLAGNVAAGAITATLNSAPSLSPGDLVILRNATDSSWNGDNGSYRQGEFLTVKSLSGAVVTFTSAVIDAYLSASATLHKVTSTSASIVGDIEVRGNSADTANLPTVFIKYGHGNVIDGVRFRNTTATCLEFSDCHRFSARVDTGKYLTDAGAIQATGVIACGQNGHIHDSQLHGDRHGVSTGGGGTVVSRFVKIDHNAISSRTAAAADFHGAAEFCEYADNHIDGGVNLSGARNKVRRNHIFPHATVTALINFEAAKSIEQTIEGNHFYLRGVTDYVVDANASTDINANTTENGIFRFHRNVIIDERAANESYLFIRNNGSTSDMEFSILDNEVRKTNASFYGNFLAATAVTGDNFTLLHYAGNKHFGTGFGIVDDFDEMLIEGDLGIGNAASASPAFGTTNFRSSRFTFEKKISVAVAGTAFTILTPDTGHSFLPESIVGRVDTDVTATTGEFISVGVSSNNRRADFGVWGTAAASSKHAKNSKMRFLNSSELANQIVDGGEVLALLSIGTNADNAAAGNNIGGASQTVTVRVTGRMIGNMASLP